MTIMLVTLRTPHIIIPVIAVGNEAMVKWAASYFVHPRVILKYVDQLQALKKAGGLPKDIWITSSDNFASWGGGDPIYHVEDLEKLYKSVDYISLHTYPMHDTHYNPEFWGVTETETLNPKKQQIDAAMQRALDYAINQYDDTKKYMESIGINKPIHIGETGWASASNGFYGKDGSRATDEYKEAIYHNLIRDWTDKNNIACFYFEAFDEPWKDAGNPGGSENHFGLFTVDGKAKYALWDKVDEGVFEELMRGKNKITKTYDGIEDALLRSVLIPAVKQKTTPE
jgi:exo-beta-1,3-glucanase (GH17 family)